MQRAEAFEEKRVYLAENILHGATKTSWWVLLLLAEAIRTNGKRYVQNTHLDSKDDVNHIGLFTEYISKYKALVTFLLQVRLRFTDYVYQYIFSSITKQFYGHDPRGKSIFGELQALNCFLQQCEGRI